MLPRHTNEVRPHVPFLMLIVTSLFALNGCKEIQGKFSASVWAGALIILAIREFIAGCVTLRQTASFFGTAE